MQNTAMCHGDCEYYYFQGLTELATAVIYQHEKILVEILHSLKERYAFNS